MTITYSDPNERINVHNAIKQLMNHRRKHNEDDYLKAYDSAVKNIHTLLKQYPLEDVLYVLKQYEKLCENHRTNNKY